MAGACAADDDADAPIAATATITAAPSTEQASDATAKSSEGATSTAASENRGTGTASTDTIAMVPEQRVPGLDSADAFCRGWSEFAGSFQALAFASAAGADGAVDGAAAARLEVVASGAVSAAAQLLADEFPEAIVFERDVFVDDVIGPFARRAGRAIDELLAAGLSSAQIEQLGDAWLEALAVADADEADVVVAVPSELIGAVGTATGVFSAGVPPIVADPSLITDAATPATLQYLAENCPDQGILGGNDAID